jgi:hypothetical protein
MKKRAWFSVALAGLWLALSGFAVAATIETNITASEVAHTADWARISANRVVYESNKNDVANDIRQIYLYDIQTKTTAQLTDDTFGSRGADIDGSRIVYIRDNGDGTYSIMLYTIGVGVTELVPGLNSTQGIRSSQYPRIAGSYVVFTTFNSATGWWDLFYVNLSDSPITPHQIGPSDGDHHSPSVAGHRVVYSNAVRGGILVENVWMYDFDSAEETQITECALGFDAWAPAVVGDHIVYMTTANGLGFSETMLYDITTHAILPIEPGVETGGVFGVDPAGGPRVIYYKYESLTNTLRLYAYNMLTGKTMTVSLPSQNLGDPASSANRAVWTQQLGDNDNYNDIILGDLVSDVPPVFVNLPGTTSPINVAEGQPIMVNPFTVSVYPTDEFGITKVEFYIDGVLRSTTTEPDLTGVYSFVWNTSLYHSNLRVVAYNTAGLTAELTRAANITLPFTGR